jgi:glycine/D-amino acid oxidase-like deaminating enzyme
MAHRPSMPDTEPVISASPYHDKVFFGHWHLGLTQATVTGAMLTAFATGDDFPVCGHFKIDRSL